MGQTDKANG